MLGKISIAIEAQIAKFESDMGRAARLAEKEAAAMKRAMSGAMTSFAGGLAAAVGGAVTAQAAFNALWNSIARADHLDELSARLQVSTEKLSGWAYAAQMSGTSLEDLSAALPKLAKNLTAALDPKSSAASLFDALGIKITDAAGKLRDVEDVLPEIADKFKDLDDSTLEASLAMEIFGKSGAGLLEFLNRGGDGIAEFEARAAALGITVSGETAAAAAEFKDRLDDLSGVMTGLSTQVAAELLPDLTKLVQWAVQFIGEGDGAREVAGEIRTTFEALGSMAEFLNGYLVGLTDVIDGLTFGFYGWKEAAEGVINLDWDQIARGMDLAGQGADLAYYGRGAGNGRYGDPKARAKPVDPEAGGIDFSKPAPMSAAELSDFQRRLYGVVGGGAGAKSGKGGKSDAQKDAEQLQRQIEQYNGRLDEQIALYGKTGEAAKVAYEIANGSLKKASDSVKEGLQAKAEWLDWLDEMKTIDEATSDAARDQADAMREQHEKAQAYLSDLQFELDLTRMSNEEKQLAIEIRRAHADGIYGEEDAIRDYLRAIQEAAEQQRLIEDVKGAAEDMFASFIDGSKSAGEAFEDFAKTLQRIAARMLAEKAVQWLFNAISGGMGGSGGMGTGDGGDGGFSGFWGGGYSGYDANFGGGRATGGATKAGKFYRVNENGPELYSEGGRSYLMAGGRDGFVTRMGTDGATAIGSAAPAPGVTVIVENNGGQARTEEGMGPDGGRFVKVVVDAAVSEVDRRINMMGSTGRAIQGRFGVSPAGVSRG